MKETEQAGDPQTFETPEKQKLRRGSRKRGSTSQVVSSRITRSRLAADWTTEELITLVTETVAIDAAFSRALPSIQKWKMISDKCTALGVGKSSDQCHRKWESLLVDYKKIKDWESKRGLVSYWSLEKERKMEHELPISFDAELFKCLDESLKLQGYQSESDHGGSESEAEVEKLNDITISDLKKQSGSAQGRQKSKRGPPKSKITETAEHQGKITESVEPEGKIVETAENESIVAETSVKKGRVGRPKVKITETTEHNGDIIEATEQNGGITQPAEEEGKTIEETVQKQRFGRPKTKVTETAEEEGKVVEAAVPKRRFGRPKTKVTEPSEQKGERTVSAEQEGKVIETAVQKGRVSGPKRKSTDTTSEQKGKETETAEENGKSTKVDVQKRVGRPKSKVIEMTQKTRADVELIHAILRGDLNPKDIDLNEPRNPGMLQTETARRQADDLIEVLGSLVDNLIQLTDMVEGRG
ncbi:hypothetical protein MKW92_010481 [Papaver armeniacum]|nr:hypothetical protein MKW92_010481 [Papaver armeniacum]